MKEKASVCFEFLYSWKAPENKSDDSIVDDDDFFLLAMDNFR
jgi:hypothetical protein